MVDNIPQNFNWYAYLFFNPDLKTAGIVDKTGALDHWKKLGYKENRRYAFDADQVGANTIDNGLKFKKMYKYFNQDIHKLSDDQISKHIITTNSNQSMANLAPALPYDFDPRLYKYYNKDLRLLSDIEVSKHYLEYGKKENRTYFCGISFDSIIENTKTSSPGSVLLINHEISKTGAPLFLYDLYEELTHRNIFKNVCMVEPFPNKILPKLNNKIYHFNNLNTLHDILLSTNPTLIYSNSLNFYLYNWDYFKYWHKKTIIHFHETMRFAKFFIDRISTDVKNIKTFVVSDTIKEEFLQNTNFTNIDVFSPFISLNKQSQIKTLYKMNHDEKNLPNLDRSKITIGMCGDISDRKNILLFLKLAIQYSQYNFVWVGGYNLMKTKASLDPDNNYVVPDNFYWVPITENPYQYFKIFDYFFLTSKEDPCPIVILENLLLNNKIIVIKNNIKTQHRKDLLENYIEIDEKTDEGVIRAFGDLDLNRLPNSTTHNSRYIDNFYSIPTLIDSKQNKPTSHHWLVASLYMNKYSDDTSMIDYYINIINQFILRHQKQFKFIPVIVLSSDHHHIYGQKTQEYLKQSILNLDAGYIIEKDNCGYDIGGLIEGIKTIYQYSINNINPQTYVAYLHNKSNCSWRNILHEIFYEEDISGFDTIAPGKFTAQYYHNNDLNTQILIDNPDIFDKESLIEKFKYVQGTTFITKLDYLKPLYKLYNKIKPQLTTAQKNDTYWQKIMKNKEIFIKYYFQYQNDPMNTPIDWESQVVVQKGGVKNYMELLDRYGLKGIPDIQFEHAMERYLGYLTCNTKQKLKLV